MAKMTVAGLDIFLTDLRNLDKEARNINKGALGEGAGYAYHELRDAIDTIPIRPDKYEGRQHSERLYGLTENEFRQVTNLFGIARFKNSSGGWNTSIGFHGMVDTPSAMWNNNVPTGYLVQCVEYGTEFRKATHILQRAINRSKDQIAQKMQDYIDKEVNKIMK